MSYSSFGSQSNPIITLPGVTCGAGTYAYLSGATNNGNTLTLPSDWGVYTDWGYGYASAGNNYAYWYVTPPSNAQDGVYKLKNVANSDSSVSYRYIQVGTSTTLVWDADTATNTIIMLFVDSVCPFVNISLTSVP